jgi:hypothetical protein
MAFTGQRRRLPESDRPYPGQLWRHDHVQVMVVAVGQNSVSFEELSRGTRGTESLDDFIAAFRRVRR